MTLRASTLARAAVLSLLLAAQGAATLASPPGAAATEGIYARPWRWTTELGEARTFDAWRGQTLVVAPFYTSCQVRCPQTLRKLSGIAEAYRRAGRPATFVLVTLDPDNDTAPRLRRFKERNGLPAAWHLLSGSAADTRGLAEFLETRTAYDASHIDHQVRIAVFDRRGHLVRNLHGWDFDVAQAVID
jgi:cytochrome oxidase Cu insertion factor (SCO1/SenC/PrrC family)